ncbi:hypothetical protein OIU76_011812 [Salix suchowensis]|nr:hypothetical protein OIU76_011812 [Salix suchowensis]
MTFSAAVSRADGTVFLPCKSDSDCEAIECAEGAAVCVNNNCHCDSKVESILASDCKHDEDCVKFPRCEDQAPPTLRRWGMEVIGLVFLRFPI